mmetsp:Transcript_4763/g.7245  ORF Transcript_4763/g.7245 Transcript_4763/m.7245 type:complete len:222 (-) Transcript_4763:149-814(-)
MKRIVIIFLILVALKTNLIDSSSNVKADADGTTDFKSEVTEEMSPKCAAVLLAASTSLGATLSYTLTPMALCSAGFCSTGVAANSFASWWQSTMPLVAKGSLFSALQSIVTGTGTNMVLPGALGGSAVGLKYMFHLCKFVDETDPDSQLGQIFDASLTMVTKAIEKKEVAKEYCDASEICTGVSDAVEQATAWASSQWGKIKSKKFHDFIITGVFEENDDV